MMLIFFFFQAEDGIRDGHVTGVQTCALPILTDEAAACLRARYCYCPHWLQPRRCGKIRVVKQETVSDDVRGAAAVEEATEPVFGGTFRALRYPNYRLIWIGFFFSNIGTWMQTVAQGWLVRELTASTALIGFVSFASSFPQIAFSLFGGVYADLFNRRKLLIGTQSVHMINAAALGALVMLRDWKLWVGLSLWHVIAITFVSGLSSTLATPTFQALMLDLV